MTRRVVLFGIGEYGPDSGLERLKHPANDVELLTQVYSGVEYGGNDAHVYPYKDIRNFAAQKIVLEQLKATERNDVLIIHFSGHGVLDSVGGLNLCFTDTEINSIEITAFQIRQLRHLIDTQNARRVLITLDCCYSARAADQVSRSFPAATLNDQLSAAEESFADGDGIYFLTAAGRSQTAKEDDGYNAGVFSWHLANGIRTGAADLTQSGKITVSDLAKYLQREVPKNAVSQNPHLDIKKGTGTFAIATNRKLLTGNMISSFRELIFGMVTDKVFSLKFGGEVVTWLEDSDDTSIVQSTRWRLLKQLQSEKITAADFQGQWVERRITQIKKKTEGNFEPAKIIEPKKNIPSEVSRDERGDSLMQKWSRYMLSKIPSEEDDNKTPHSVRQDKHHGLGRSGARPKNDKSKNNY